MIPTKFRFIWPSVSVVCHPFSFHILIFSSENPQPNELKLDRKLLSREAANANFTVFGSTALDVNMLTITSLMPLCMVKYT
jgi:hypothetical protein